MSDPPRHASTPGSATDVDLFCLECGYNLRGLSGDPRRCPECGHLNPVGDLELPAEAIACQLRQMESNPAICAGMALIGGPFTLLFCLALALSPPGTQVDELLCFLIPTAVAVIVWIVCVVGFRKSCRARPGWEGVLWHYHVYALGLCVLVGGPLLVPLILFGASVDHYNSTLISYFVVALAVALSVSLLVIFTLGRKAHRKLKAILEPLQREAAVNIAREILRRRIARRRVW
jgi:hypothetical protein